MLHVRTWQKCPKCGGPYKYIKKTLSCPDCLTIPTMCYLEWFYKGEQFKQYGYNSLIDAQRQAVQIENEIRTHRFSPEAYRKDTPKLPNKYNVDHITKLYLKERKDNVSWDGKDENGLSPSSYKKTEQHLKEFYLWCQDNGIADIRCIKTYEIRQFKNYLKTERPKLIRNKEKIYPANNAKTIKCKFGDIKKFLYDVRVLYGEDFVPDMPLFDKIKTKEPEITIMGDDKRLLAISKLPLEHQPLFCFMRLVAVRPCEATGLKHSHIVWDGNIPYWLVQAAFSEGYYRQKTKTKNQWAIPLKQEEIEIIKSVPRSLQTDCVFYWIDKRDKNKHKPYGGEMIRRLWKEACEAAGIDYIPPYPTFRHSTITKWLDDGMLEEDASSLVGHVCRSTIKKYDRSKRIERLMKAKMAIS